MLVVHVDDVCMATNNTAELKFLKENLGKQFKFKDCGELSFFLGLEVARDRSQKKLYLFQSTFASNVFKRFWPEGDCRATAVPMTPGYYLDSIRDDEDSSANHSEIWWVHLCI